MAFKVSILDHDSCDKCKAKASKESPVIEIFAAVEGEHSKIYVHERCLIKSIDKAKKDYAKEPLGV